MVSMYRLLDVRYLKPVSAHTGHAKVSNNDDDTMKSSLTYGAMAQNTNIHTIELRVLS
jgi:hypothetical protein